MFNLNETMCYYLYPEPVSMRKGIHSLCGVVHEQMGCEIKSGDWQELFLMVEGIVPPNFL